MREKAMLAQRAEQHPDSDAFEMRIAVRYHDTTDEKTYVEGTPPFFDVEPTPTMFVRCDPERDAVAAERAPSHLYVRLISLLHQICLLLAMAGVALSFSGIVYEAQIRN